MSRESSARGSLDRDRLAVEGADDPAHERKAAVSVPDKNVVMILDPVNGKMVANIDVRQA
jgi:hypothetical protein